MTDNRRLDSELISEVISEVEDMILDFIIYRKTRNISNYSIQNQCDIGKGWPHYKDMEALPAPLFVPGEDDREDEWYI